MTECAVETPRLLLRHWQPSDYEPFVRMNADAAVMCYFPAPYSPEQSQHLFESIQQELADYGYGLYAAQEKTSGQFMGFIGFHQAMFGADFCPCIEIAWRLLPSFWNKGYATEGARACLDYGWQILGLSTVYSFTAAVNAPSERVMHKIGMCFERLFEHPSLPQGHPLRPHVLYVARAKLPEQ